MALNLFAKKLSQRPIGTHVELTIDSGPNLEKVTGVITDSDFTTSVEITTPEGNERILDYSLIKGCQVTKSLEEVLKELSNGTKILFSYGSEDNREPNLSGTVGENDGQEGIEIITSNGNDLVLTYSIIRSLRVLSGNTPKHSTPAPTAVSAPAPTPAPAPVPKPVQPILSTGKEPLSEQSPVNLLNVGDNELKRLFSRMSREEQQKLGSMYERFKYGVKISDKSKMKEAANQARQLLFFEDDNGTLCWSREAVLFCGNLLGRAHTYDPEVLLVGECFDEAAFAAWKEGKFDAAGAYAITALLEGTEHISDMTVILGHAVVKGNDVSGISLVANRIPEKVAPQFKRVVKEAFEAKGVRLSAEQDLTAALTMLSTLYPNKEMAEELKYWLPKEVAAPQKTVTVQKSAQPVKTVDPVNCHGTITKLMWMNRTGTITDEDGNTYSFRYEDIADASLAKPIQTCMDGELNGKTYPVKFHADGKAARNIYSDALLVDRARAVASTATKLDRFEVAFDLCKKAVGTSDSRRALGDLIKYAMNLYSAKQQTGAVKEALELFEKNIIHYPNDAFAIMDIARCYSYLKKHSKMLEYAEKAFSFSGLNAKQRIAVLCDYLKMAKEYYEVCGDKKLLESMLKKIMDVSDNYSQDFASDSKVRQNYHCAVTPYLVIAYCGTGNLQEAEEAYSRVPEVSSFRPYIDELMAKTRKRLAPKVERISGDAETGAFDDGYAGEGEYYEETFEDEVEEEILPYTDADGWKALGLTKEDVIDYALNITGPDRIPAMLAYLRAGSNLNQAIEPVYQMVALAANDPMSAHNYNITALESGLDAGDPNYPELNNCCMSAAFLRASFRSGRGFDYSAQGLWNRVNICQTVPVLQDVCDTLEAFRKEVEREIDIYADYRNEVVKKLDEDLDATVAGAKDLYTKFVENPAREGVRFARLLETKKIVFAKDGYLATMLRRITERDQEALEAEKEQFVATYLNGVAQFSGKHINSHAIEDMITECWNEAGKGLQMKKLNETLQGNRRNNIRSSISNILEVICQWYALTEQSAGLTWRTEQGVEAYQRLSPRLKEQLNALSEQCHEQIDGCTDPERCTGLFLLAATAQELSARLDGSWKYEQEKYLYVDFLRSNNVLLNQDFMPDLSSTFCVLPSFNILARIRQHVEGEKLSFQEQINQIYGMDKNCNNYGTADRIMEFVEAQIGTESAELPENADRFPSHTEMQNELRYRSFRETYAFAMNAGQIIKSDVFCCTLEDTVRYWYTVCKETRNFGFFTNILRQSEDQIHASAQQYEETLAEQLDALVATNQQYFADHPDYEDAVREQIANQRFTVAEDWMTRIRLDDFALEVLQPEAITYLEHFWNSYVVTYNQVADARLTLSALLGRRNVHNKDTKRAQQMIDNWLKSGSSSNSQRIEQLLNVLGWQNIQVSQYHFAAEPRGEFYEVSKASSAAGLTTPLHPIAAFGSNLDKKRMYVVCLYGIYDCDRLYEKMRALDVIDGSKVILLDYALGQADRRALARKLKKRESCLRHVNIVIDRVLITHLANNYNENLINRILMATAMPFTYCQPYVVESVHTMPPEIFIGRRDELLKIEESDGVNLIYGGRQLGKSALFKKALADLNGRHGQRAVLVDIKDLNCAGAAKRLSEELIDLKITPNAEVTDDWDELCRNIKQRLRSEEDPISYLLVMLDEADTFIDDCANYGYRPMVALKDIQQSLSGQFKYVLAGLHNIVRFNRQVALGNNSVITHMPSLKITPFRTPEAEELLIEPLSYLGFSLPSKVTVSQIIATCNYFPGLIQLYAKKLIESIRAADYAGYDVKKAPPYIVSDEHLRRVMADKEFVEQIHEKFEITLKLDQDQGSCYYPLTLLIGWMHSDVNSKSGYTAQDVLHHAKANAIYPLADLDVEKINALLMELQDLNILRSVSDNSYLLASKNFRDLLGSDEEIFEKLTSFGGAVV